MKLFGIMYGLSIIITKYLYGNFIFSIMSVFSYIYVLIIDVYDIIIIDTVFYDGLL